MKILYRHLIVSPRVPLTVWEKAGLPMRMMRFKTHE